MRKESQFDLGKLRKNLVQFIKFGIVGISNTIIGYLINIGVIFILSRYDVNWDYIAGNIAEFILSVLWAFYWSNRFVFKLEDGEKRNILKSLLRTYMAYGFTGIILNNLLGYLWIEVLGINKYISPIINVLISAPINYLINKFWSFKKDIRCE